MPSDIKLCWETKHLQLWPEDTGGYEWADTQNTNSSRTSRLCHPVQFGNPQRSKENLLIQGDALDGMRSLWKLDRYSERYAGRVALCYIDPPFNRGEDFGHYDDALDRGAWLTMLRDRLVEIRKLLAPDGSIWLHLDDTAQHHGRCLLDEVFGSDAFVTTVVWQRRTSRESRKAFSSMHDYIHVYAPIGSSAWKLRRNGLPDGGHFANPDGDLRGPWRSVPLTAQAGHATRQQFYSLVSPGGVKHDPPPGRCWTYTKARFDELLAAGRVYWPRNGNGKPRLKRYQDEATGLAPFTIWMADDVGENADAKRDMLTLFPDRAAFDTPKPEALLERILHIGTQPGELVLDCFLGSGTTAAVAHKMQRRWIGIERSVEVVDSFALPRLRQVVEGSDNIGITQKAGWTGGGGFTLLTVDAVVSGRETDAEAS